MKTFFVVISLLISSINIFADAAIEIQEGSVKNWIKYYEEQEHEQQTVQRTTGQIQSTDN